MDDVEGTEMEGVEHLGQYVFEMTQAKVEMLKKGVNVLPPQEAVIGHMEDQEMDDEGFEMEEPEESELAEVT